MNQSSRVVAVIVAAALGAGGITLLMMSNSPQAKSKLGMQPGPIQLEASSRPSTSPSATLTPFNQGRRLARQKKFPEALDQYRLAMQVDPSNDRVWTHLACLLAYTGDTAAYESHCRQMLETPFTGIDPSSVADLVRSCMIMPRSQEEVTKAAQLLDRQVNRGVPPNHFPFVQLAKGVVEYRRGQFAESIDSLTQAHETLDFDNAPLVKATALLFLGMAQHRNGQTSDAQSALDAANKIFDQLPTIKRGDVGPVVHNWVMWEMARREVDAIIPSQIQN